MGAIDANVLVLNSDYLPLNVCNVRRAVVLLEKEKAQTVELDGVLIRSERRSLRAPSVIRLSYHVKRPRPVVKLTRREILARDDHKCQYCGKRGNDLTIDHVTPRHRGGQHTWENVVTACKGCNHRKGAALPFLLVHQVGRAHVAQVPRGGRHRSSVIDRKPGASAYARARRPRRGPPGAQTEARSDEVEHRGPREGCARPRVGMR